MNQSAAVHTTDWNSPQGALRRTESRGKPSKLTRGAWVADLCALKKAVALCLHCMPKFDHRQNGYEPRSVVPGHRYVNGECDGCAARHARCKIYLPVETR